VRTRNYIVMREQDDALDLMALAEEAQFGKRGDAPVSTTAREIAEWVEAGDAGIPERSAPPQPWAPRTPSPAVAPAAPEPVAPEPVLP
jgi:hypothetical protein